MGTEDPLNRGITWNKWLDKTSFSPYIITAVLHSIDQRLGSNLSIVYIHKKMARCLDPSTINNDDETLLCDNTKVYSHCRAYVWLVTIITKREKIPLNGLDTPEPIEEELDEGAFIWRRVLWKETSSRIISCTYLIRGFLCGFDRTLASFYMTISNAE